MNPSRSSDPTPGYLILFCGLPGTLKTFLSVRMSGRLGFAYLPTRSVGSIKMNCPPELLKEARQERYRMLSKVAQEALGLGANIVIDGGFTTSQSRESVLGSVPPRKAVIVHCLCSDESVRRGRLEVRASDPVDYERQSAKEILSSRESVEQHTADDPEAELEAGRICALMEIDTAKMLLRWKGEPPPELAKKIPSIVAELLEEYNGKQVPHSYDLEVRSHFDQLADDYEQTPEWRQNTELLKSLHRELPRHPSRVLDVGAGTGLASAWYAEQGHHVVGIDLSPSMLRKAAERLTLTVIGDAARLPFLDNYFDVAVIRQSLHYVTPIRLLSEIRRTLKSDGMLGLSAAICPSERSRNLWEEFKSATQPLRLRVFTEEDLTEYLTESGFAVRERSAYTLPRRERLSSIEARAPEPPAGWRPFMENVVKIAAKVAPELELSLNGDLVEYKQYWVTLWASPVDASR